MFGRREKSNTIGINDTTQSGKSEGTGERRKTKKILRYDQTMQTKKTIKTTKENSTSK